jgi:hypothetical protein
LLDRLKNPEKILRYLLSRIAEPTDRLQEKKVAELLDESRA